MLVTKIFLHFEVPTSDEIFISQKPTDTINLSTLKRIKIIKEQGKWVAKTKRFDTESGPSKLPSECDEAMRDNNQDEEDTPPPSPLRGIPRSSFPSSSSNFTFSKDHYNLLNGRIDSLTSTIDSLQNLVDGLTSLLQQVLASQQELNTRFDIVFPPPPPSEALDFYLHFKNILAYGLGRVREELESPESYDEKKVSRSETDERLHAIAMHD
ncbi:Uncharacterized protein Adt_23646 [Abeliophyllum distichum]|uniref:Uncharacterized protein n=1 Tax=Abeliophyllum distichum TaxID=126358 RepID=A0ABD1SBH6_9LAMI